MDGRMDSSVPRVIGMQWLSCLCIVATSFLVVAGVPLHESLVYSYMDPSVACATFAVNAKCQAGCQDLLS